MNIPLFITNCDKLLIVGDGASCCYCPCKQCKWKAVYNNPCKYFSSNIVGVRIVDEHINIKKVLNCILRFLHIIYIGVRYDKYFNYRL